MVETFYFPKVPCAQFSFSDFLLRFTTAEITGLLKLPHFHMTQVAKSQQKKGAFKVNYMQKEPSEASF